MQPQNPNSFVRLDPETDQQFGDRRAFVQLQPSVKDFELRQAMDQAADDAAVHALRRGGL